MTRKVILLGELGDRFGREWNLHVTTPGQALALIRANRPGLAQYLAQCTSDGVGFVCTIDDQIVGAERLLGPIAANETLTIQPMAEAAGEGKSIGIIVLGVVLIALSAFTAGATGVLGTGLIGGTGTSAFLANVGLALAFSGTAQLIAGQPTFEQPKERATENEGSYLFDGPTNRTRQGNPIPLVYGLMLHGGDPISLGISNEQWIEPEDTDLGTVTGDGYSDPGSSSYAIEKAVFEVVNGEGSYGGWVPPAAGGGGKGGSGDAGRSSVEAPDSYKSVGYARVKDILCEGEAAGPVDRDGNPVAGAFNLGLALYLDETQVQNNDGSYNFKNIKAWFQPGTPDQKHIPGFDGTETQVSVNVEATNSTPATSNITDTTTDAVRVSVRIPQMYFRNLTNGNVDGYTVTIAIELNYDSGGYSEVLRHTFRQKNTSATIHDFRLDLQSFSTDCLVKLVRISDDETASNKINNTWFHAVTRIQDEKLNHPLTCMLAYDLDATQFSRVPARAIRMRGIKVQVPDNYDPIEKTYTGVWSGAYSTLWTDNPAWIFLDLITNIRYGLGRWITVTQNDVAELYTISQNNDELVTMGIPKAVTVVEAFSTSATSIKISIPPAWIEDGDTLVTSGGNITVDGKIRQGARDVAITSGSLIVGATYRIIALESGVTDFTNVGASANTLGFTFVATGTTPTAWGSTGSLQPHYKTIAVDATGHGQAQGDAVAFTGREPRFTCNLVMEAQQDAYRAILDLASTFRAMPYWGGGLYKVVQDVAKDSLLTFTNANVVGGNFEYSFSALNARHTTAIVRYNDPGNFYRAKTIYVEDPQGIFKWGIRETSLVAFGCTSESQAMRWGRSVLIGERLEARAITWAAGPEAHALSPGAIADTYDNELANVVLAGRLVECSLTEAVLDREVNLVSGNTYELTVTLPDGTGLVTKTITLPAAGSTTNITFNTLTTAELPVRGSVYVIQDTSTSTLIKARILSVLEKEKGVITVTGHEYKPAKFAEIEAIEREAPREPIASLRQVIPPTSLDVITEKISTDLSTARFATATWSPTADKNVRGYVVTSRRDDGDWEPRQETFATNLRIPLQAPGLYEFQVMAKNGMGFLSGPASTTFTLTEDGLVIGTTSPPVIDPLGGNKPDGVSLADCRMINEEGESEVRYTITDEEQITSGTPTSGQDYEIIDSTTGGVITSGTPAAISYRITGNTGADFTGIGAADNNLGTVFTASGGTPTWGTAGELTPNANSDFVVAGSANNTIGTSFTSNGVAPIWGTSGELRKVTDTDPLTTSETVYTHNPNWLLRSNEVKNASWTKTDGTVTDEGVISDPAGGKNSDQIEPTGAPKRIEVFQAVTIANLYKGQYWTFSGYERVTNSTFALLRFTLTEQGGASADASTTFDFIPTPGAWGLRSLTHQIQQTDRTGLKITVSAENANNPNDKFLFCFGYQLEMGRQRTKYTANAATGGGNFTVPSYAGTTSVRARTFITEEVFSAMAEESYDFATGATTVAEPDVRPLPGEFQGTEFPLTIVIEQLEPATVVTKYTTDGSDPATGTTYSAPFTITAGQQVRALTTKATFTDSEERQGDYGQGF